jgi:hypothetical protein
MGQENVTQREACTQMFFTQTPTVSSQDLQKHPQTSLKNQSCILTNW